MKKKFTVSRANGDDVRVGDSLGNFTTIHYLAASFIFGYKYWLPQAQEVLINVKDARKCPEQS